MSSAKSRLFSPFKRFIHADFQESFQKMTITDKLLFLNVHSIDKSRIKWHRLPVFLGVSYLAMRRRLHDKYNLINVGKTTLVEGGRFNASDVPYRTADGTFNDPLNEAVGGQGTFFGRNMLPVNQKDKLLKPDPMVVATKLLERKKFIDTDKQFNMIAASWIQFMIHDWIDHLESTQQIELKAPMEVANQCPLKSFKFYKTKEVDTGFDGIRKGHINIRTPWWDGSGIYGSNFVELSRVRTLKDGKLKINAEDGLLQHDKNGLPIAGDIRNNWIGVSTLQALFILEHNAVCEALKKEYHDLEDEDLYRHARLVTSAVIAKIHTIDWTTELLKTDTLRAAMRANWYGILGKRFKDTFGHVGGAILGGLVGLKKPDNHGVPYSLTEEFTSVYRMHSLLPDQLHIRDVNSAPGTKKSPKLTKKVDMTSLIGGRGEKELSENGYTRMVSMGHQACGQLELWNYPMWLRNMVPQNVDGSDRPDHVDLAALEIYRDRERNVARYNEFRRSLFMIPISTWEDLTDDAKAISTLREVYDNDVEQLDILVGMAAEKKIKGFAISETAFVIFIIMASRRLHADRFFTSDFNKNVYTKKGLEWVNTTESLKDVLDRHYPDMTDRWMNSTSAFSVWDAPPEPHNPIPTYFRFPK